MTVTGGFPAPGPQDHEPPRDQSYGAPTAPGSLTRPPDPSLTAHKPGIVSLRPMELGDILDGAVKAVRFNPMAMVGLSALVLGALLVPSAAMGVGATRLMVDFLNGLGPGAQAFLGVPSSAIESFFQALAAVILSGLLSQVVSQAVLGHRPDLAQTWQSTRGRLMPLLTLGLLVVLVNLLSVAALLGPGVFLIAGGNVAAGVVLLFFGLFGLVAVTLAISTKVSMAGPAIVLEGHGILAGLRRSFALTRGAAFWRLLGITLLAGIIAGVVGFLLGMPFTIIGTMIATGIGPNTENGQMVLTFTSHLSALVTGAITTPFVAAVSCLLYIDRRMRLEALDVVLLRQGQSNPAPRI